MLQMADNEYGYIKPKTTSKPFVYGDSSEDQNDQYGIRDSPTKPKPKTKNEDDNIDNKSEDTSISNSKKLSIS
jgi:hypothetical protein